MRFLLIGTLVVILSCSQKSNPAQEVITNQTTHAKKFQLFEERVVVTEPWPGAVRPITYSLGTSPKRVVVTSTTHLPYLEMLGVADRIVGFPGTNYISSPKIRKMVSNGQITDLGPDGAMNLEILISLQPDIVFAFDMGSESTTLDKISEAGIQVVYNADFLENTTLGRAEWIRFFGAFFQKRKQADSIFSAISSNYDSLRSLALTTSNRPTVLSGVLYGDSWYMPGGKNGSAQLFEDAGGNYLWSDTEASGWLELSFEAVYAKAYQADFWIGVATFNSLDQLNGQDQRYAEFEAFRQLKVFSYNKQISPSGGYDYFESGYARPDVVLADLIKILHPEVLPDYETYYFQAIQ